MATLPMPRAMPPLANLRDVGGHAVRGGGRVRRGVLYRSTDLSALDDPGLEVLAGLGVRTVYDLRTRIERETHPDRLPDGARLLVADVLEGAPPEGSPFHLMSVLQDPGAIGAVLANGGADRFFVDRYRELVELDSAREGFGRMFRDIALSGHRPGLVHCTTGKDRTGWAVASLLLLLGVAEDAVMEEYLLSNVAMEAVFAGELEALRARGIDPDLMRPLTGVREAYLGTALATMRAQYGTIDAYFETGLGVDGPTRETLRTAFLEA